MQHHTTALHQAVRYNHFVMVRSLLRLGVDPSAQDAIGRTPLHLVQSIEVAHLLISAGAPINVRDRLGNSPLHLVNNTAVAFALIEAGADIDAVNFDQLEPDQMGHDQTNQAIAMVREERVVESRVRFQCRPVLAGAF